MTSLFDPLDCGTLSLPNRVIMAPLTRLRSKQPGNIPWELNAEYYAQRASAGLLISEATQICPQGQGYPASPGIHSVEQVQGWKKVTQAVHEQGGRIFLQLWHVGRISHSSFQPDGGAPVAPSALRVSGKKTLTSDWKQVDFEMPRALETEEIPGIVNQYALAAINAKEANFDGVEVHGANGYLLDQFLQDGTNHRTDRYGGSIEGRSRLLLGVVDAVKKVWGADRVGVRLSPFGTFNDMHDSDPKALFSYVLGELSRRAIAYVHLIEPRALPSTQDENLAGVPETAKLFRGSFAGVLISAGGYDREDAIKAIEECRADAIAFGRLFIANPDLPKRLAQNSELNSYDRDTFYGGEARGYTDYPALPPALVES